MPEGIPKLIFKNPLFIITAIISPNGYDGFDNPLAKKPVQGSHNETSNSRYTT